MRQLASLCFAFAAALASGSAGASAGWCDDAASCAKFCTGEKVNAAAVHAKGYRDPTGLVSLSSISEAAGCGKRQKDAVKCGLYATGDGKVVPALKPAILEAVRRLRAVSPSYVLVIDSSFRSVLFDTERICKKIATGQKEANGRLCGIELACPGPNSHSNGYALDAHLHRADKLFDARGRYNFRGALTPPPGRTKTCKASVKGIHDEKDQHMRKLNEQLFALGFWRYCWEDWHFELSREPLNELRTNCLADADCKGGKKCVAKKVGSDQVLACK